MTTKILIGKEVSGKKFERKTFCFDFNHHMLLGLVVGIQNLGCSKFDLLCIFFLTHNII